MLRLLSVLVIAGGLLAACTESTTGLTPTPTATATPVGFSPLAVLQQSTETMTAVESLRATMDAGLVSPEGSMTWAMEMELAADDTARVVMTITTPSETEGAPDEQRHFELVKSPTHVYLKEPDAGWVRTSLETADMTPSTFDPNLFRGMFEGEDIPWESVTVEALGMEDVSGVPAEHLRVNVDFLAMMQAQLQQLQEEMGVAELPEGFSMDGFSLDGLFGEEVTLMPTFEVELWVDQQGFVRKQSLQMSLGIVMAVTMDAEVFDINEEIVIELPTDYVESEGPLPIPQPLG